MLVIWFESPNGGRSHAHNNCDADSSPPDPRPTETDILRAFRQIPLPPSRLTIQPPGGATLVNFETNVFTEARPFERTVTLLGHRVHFRIRPQRYTWHFGDDEPSADRTTTSPGAPYPDLQVTHRYRTKGTVHASVDTTWQADYQLDGTGWTPVTGTVTIAGARQSLTVKTATPILTG